MGFWSSLVHTGFQVAHWVSNNAGSIAEAAGVIAKVIGAVAVTDEELAAEGDNILPQLTSHISKAEKMLLQQAANHFPQPTVPSGSTLKTIDMSALWPNPGSSDNPKPVPEITMDINRLLACNRIPNSVGADQPDVGDQVAAQLFNGTDPQVVAAAADAEILFNSVSVRVGRDSYITGGMAFYRIPLGNPGSHKAWHSHLRLYYTSSSDDEERFRAELAALAVTGRRGKVRDGDSYNSVTVSVQWTGARAVRQVMSSAVQKMVNESAGKMELLKPSVMDGTRFKYQFKTETTVGPADVAAALSSAISAALPTPDKDHPQPRMPTVKVANLQTYVV